MVFHSPFLHKLCCRHSLNLSKQSFFFAPILKCQKYFHEFFARIKMSLNLDDWLKPPEEPNVPPNPEIDDEDPITNSLAAADLQLPDLG